MWCDLEVIRATVPALAYSLRSTSVGRRGATTLAGGPISVLRYLN